MQAFKFMYRYFNYFLATYFDFCEKKERMIKRESKKKGEKKKVGSSLFIREEKGSSFTVSVGVSLFF